MSAMRARLGYILVSAIGLAGCVSSSNVADPQALALERSALTAHEAEVDKLVFDVAVRSGRATIHATVFTQPDDCAHGVTVLAVPGGNASASQFGPLARAILSDERLSPKVRRIVALDFPGHGDSPFPTHLPEGTQFGDLLIEDDASMLLQTIDKLGEMELGPRVVLTHSQGGLLLQTVQQMLLSDGSSLAAHGVTQAVLMSPVPPHGLPWEQAPSSGGAVEFTDDPMLGTFMTVPTTPEGAVEFLRTCFSNNAGDRVPSAPTGQEILANRYIATEPVSLVAEIVEYEETLPDGSTVVARRPTIDAGAFAPDKGTRLTVVSFSEDRAIHAGDAHALYEYLTGDVDDHFYRPLVSPNAVHCMLISDPNELLSALAADIVAGRPRRASFAP